MAARPKALTREQIEGRKTKAVRFVRDVLGDPDRADEIADEGLEDYAERRGIQILNPQRRCIMTGKTIEDYKAELRDAKAQIRDLEEENETLQDQLDEISEIISPEAEREEEEEEEEEDEPGVGE